MTGITRRQALAGLAALVMAPGAISAADPGGFVLPPRLVGALSRDTIRGRWYVVYSSVPICAGACYRLGREAERAAATMRRFTKQAAALEWDEGPDAVVSKETL